MIATTISRRALLIRACQIPAAAIAVSLAACVDKNKTAACADPDQLSQSEISLRASVQYTDRAPDPTKACGGCAYFRASSDATECGRCDILNGSVSVTGHCSSWSAKS
jgi:uncharacterized paraquat-inducible protein A